MLTQRTLLGSKWPLIRRCQEQNRGGILRINLCGELSVHDVRWVPPRGPGVLCSKPLALMWMHRPDRARLRERRTWLGSRSRSVKESCLPRYRGDHAVCRDSAVQNPWSWRSPWCESHGTRCPGCTFCVLASLAHHLPLSPELVRHRSHRKYPQEVELRRPGLGRHSWEGT